MSSTCRNGGWLPIRCCGLLSAHNDGHGPCRNGGMPPPRNGGWARLCTPPGAAHGAPSTAVVIIEYSVTTPGPMTKQSRVGDIEDQQVCDALLLDSINVYCVAYG